MSSGPSIQAGTNVTPSVWLATSRRFSPTRLGSRWSVNTPTVRSLGMASFSNPRRFGCSSRSSVATPVTLPPGRASELTTPRPIGSVPVTNTIGTELVARETSLAMRSVGATTTSGRRCSSSLASGSQRAGSPSDRRTSTLRLSPSIQPLRAGARRSERPKRHRSPARTARGRRPVVSLTSIEPARPRAAGSGKHRRPSPRHGGCSCLRPYDARQRRAERQRDHHDPHGRAHVDPGPPLRSGRGTRETGSPTGCLGPGVHEVHSTFQSSLAPGSHAPGASAGAPEPHRRDGRL